MTSVTMYQAKRQEELENLRRQSLAKNHASRLKDAEIPIGMRNSPNFNDFATKRRQFDKQQRLKQCEAKEILNTYRADDQAILLEKGRLDTLKSQTGSKSTQKAKQLLHQYKAVESTVKAETKRISALKHKKKYSEARSSFFLSLESEEIEERVRSNKHHPHSPSSTRSSYSFTPPSSPVQSCSSNPSGKDPEKNLEAVCRRLWGIDALDMPSLSGVSNLKHSGASTVSTDPCSATVCSTASASHSVPASVLDCETHSVSTFGSEHSTTSELRQTSALTKNSNTKSLQDVLDVYVDDNDGTKEEEDCFACKMM